MGSEDIFPNKVRWYIYCKFFLNVVDCGESVVATLCAKKRSHRSSTLLPVGQRLAEAFLNIPVRPSGLTQQPWRYWRLKRPAPICTFWNRQDRGWYPNSWPMAEFAWQKINFRLSGQLPWPCWHGMDLTHIENTGIWLSIS